MTRILLAGVALVAFATGPGLAADLPARMPTKAPVMAPAVIHDWTGFYIGGHGGGGWGEKCFAFVGVGDGCHDVSGWVGGGQLGFNWQAGNFVFGAEFSGSASRLTGSHATLLAPGSTLDTRVDSILLLTGRVGMTWDRLLAFVTGGGAWVHDRHNFSTGLLASSARDDRWGWTVGAGLEFALTPNWSVAGQYNYVDLGNRDTGFTGTAGTFNYNIDQQLHLATVRVNYRFGGPVSARY
jgi:outer membrane immunogenic protein